MSWASLQAAQSDAEHALDWGAFRTEKLLRVIQDIRCREGRGDDDKRRDIRSGCRAQARLVDCALQGHLFGTIFTVTRTE